MAKRTKKRSLSLPSSDGYDAVLGDIGKLLESARHTAARSINSILTLSYWKIGERIVEFEQGGQERADYGSELLKRLSVDLTKRFGRGFSRVNLQNMRLFYEQWPICQTVSDKLTACSAPSFPLPWSHYVCLLAVKSQDARNFYEAEAIRGGWSIRQLNRQIDSQFYERTALSKDKPAMLLGGQQTSPEDVVTPEQAIKDPYVLEFLDLKDEYSESDLESALIGKLETFLLELGGDFTFVGRQRRLRIDDEWYRIDLLFFHRRLRCLVVVDLKLGKFTHADAGQMHLYLNYAAEHWVLPGENPPVGLILCASKGSTLAKYALSGLPNQVLAAEYRLALPDESAIAAELQNARKLLEDRTHGQA